MRILQYRTTWAWGCGKWEYKTISDADELKEMVTSQYNCSEVLKCDLTPVMTTHTGPAVGICYYS